MDRVFRRHKTAEVSVIKSKKKFLADKDAPQRLKHLKVLIVQLDRTELHQFFQENYSAVFHTFSDAFFSAEYELKQKVNVSNLKELDNLLLVFENILLLLPEYIHQRWQYNCILEVLEELLNERNALSTRKEGIRLFLLWYQILGTNATNKCHQLFTNLVPDFGDLIQEFHKRETLRDPGNLNLQTNDVVRSHHLKQSFGVQPIELTVLVPPLLVEPFEGNQDIGFELLQHFLHVLVTEVAKVTWTEHVKERHLLQFWFLFEQLKRTYLPLIFPCLSPMYSIYGSSQPKAFGSDSEIANVLRDYPIPTNRLSVFQEYFILWLTKFINSSPKYHVVDPAIPTDDRLVTGQSGSQLGLTAGAKSTTDDSQVDAKGLSKVDTIGSPAPDSQQYSFESTDTQAGVPGARRDTRTDGPRVSNTPHAITHGTNVLQDQADRRSSSLSQSYPKESSYASPDEIMMVCAVLYGCRQNINLLHDILHHAFLLPISCYQALFAVISVYSSWLDDKSTRPIFLQEVNPLDDWNGQPARNNIVTKLDSPTEDRGHEGDDEAEYPKDSLVSGRASSSRLNHAPPSGRRPMPTHDNDPSNEPPIRSDSDSSSPINTTGHGAFSGAAAMGSCHNGTTHTEELRGCFQTTIQVMFDNMSKVFLLRCPPAVQTAVADRPGNLTRYTVDYVRQQVELCRKILRFFRAAAISNELSTESWTKLLSTLLEVLNATMVGLLPADRKANSWLSNEQLIQTLFQTMNVALLRASLFVPISNEPWDQCLVIYSQLTDWPALIIEWRKTMETLTSTMARLVYGVDLANLPDDKKTRYGKRNLAQNSVVRARPKSFTDAAVNHSTAFPSTGVLSQSSVHVTSGNLAGGLPKTPPAQYDDLRGRHSLSSNERTRTPTSVPAAAALDWSEVPTDASASLGFGNITVDSRPAYTTEDDDDSVSLNLNGTLSRDAIDLRDTDTLLRSPSHSRSLHPRSVTGTPRQQQRRVSGHLVSEEPNFFSLRRAASDLNEIRPDALGFSPHDPTFGITKGFTQPNRATMNGSAPKGTMHQSISPDNLSVLSIGSVVDRRSRRISLSQSYESPLRKVDPSSARSPSPSAVTASLDDDSSSNMSRSERVTSSRTSGDETSDHMIRPSSPTAMNSSPRSNLAEARYPENHEPIILPDSIRPTSRYLHRGDTLTADSLPQSFPVDTTQTPTKSKVHPNPIPALSDIATPRCVLAGGLACGWTAESVVVCWRRFLGILGRINAIRDKENLDRIYAYFADLTSVLLKIREHQLLGPISQDCVQPTPNYVVPVEFILPTLFEALQIPNHPESVKVTAIRILGDAVIRPVDGKFNEEVLSQFYLMLHRFLTGFEERYIREVIRACGARFFGSGLPGAHLLLLDFLRGAALVLGEQSGVTDAPRSQALLMYISLLCYPYHFGPLDSLEPNSSMTFKLSTCHDLKQKLLHALTQVTQSDPNAEARCLALTALAMHCVIELIHLRTDNTPSRGVSCQNNFVIDALVVLLGMMRFQDHSVALVAVEMVIMLADFCEFLLNYLPRFPVIIIRTIAWTLKLLWQSLSSNKVSVIDKRLLVALVVGLVEWTLRLPRTLVRAPIERTDGVVDDQESVESALSLVLSTLDAIICYPPSSLSIKTGSEESAPTVPDSFIPFPDPLLDCLSDCQSHIEIASFSAPKSRLDGSSLAMKAFLMTDFGHPWSGFQLAGEDPYSSLQSIRLAARVAMCQVLNYLDHFPMDPQGALLNTCIQENHDQIESDHCANPRTAVERELTSEILESSNTQLFVINDSVLVSFLSLPSCASAIDNPLHRVIHVSPKSDRPSLPVADDAPVSGSTAPGVGLTDLFPLRPVARQPASTTKQKFHTHSAVSDTHYTRIIVRDFSGKYSWDLSCLYGLWNGPNTQTRSQSVPCTGSDGTESAHDLVHIDSRGGSAQSTRNPPPCPPPRLNPNPPPLNETTPGMTMGNSTTLATHSERFVERAANNSPVVEETTRSDPLPKPTPATDALRSLLLELTSSSPECSITWSPTAPGASDRDDPASCLNTPCFNMEALTGDQITAQCQLDTEAIELRSNRRAVSPASDTDIQTGQSTPYSSPTANVFDPFSQWSVYCGQFAVARHLFNQLGFLSWERRRTVELVQKSAGLVRDLKHLDKLGARETHKIAVFYVGAGQEDKQSILSNQTASLEFENFVAGLGWEIDLRTHRGFRGGLERSGRAGDSTPYYATATIEVIFHVSTRMPSSTQEDLKYKHLGNDEVMIIWTENARAFHRSMLRTQFGDVLIIISPLPTGLFRVEVRRESDVGFFGPIVHSAILDGFVLPALVRATAINASRAIRTMKPGYRAHYEERAASLRQLITRHALPTCFEAFTESLFLPSTSLDSGLSPPRNIPPTDSTDMVSTVRTQDLPIEPVSAIPITMPAPSTTNTFSSRAGPVAKDSTQSWSQYHTSFVDHPRNESVARSRKDTPKPVVHSTPATAVTDSSTDSAVAGIPRRVKRHPHHQHSSVDRAYGGRNQFESHPSPVNNTSQQPLYAQFLPVTHLGHHLRHLLPHKSRHRP